MAPVITPTGDMEQHLFDNGATMVIGIDEVGRGSIAGPVAVGLCAVVPGFVPPPEGVRDSKLLSAKKREILAPLTKEWATATAVGYAEATEVETLGITKALALAGMRAFDVLASEVNVEGGVILLDGSQNWLRDTNVPLKVVMREKADRDCYSVAGASIVAKVERDALMVEMHLKYPHYGWDSNKGYGAAVHYAGIREHGIVTGFHRASWIKNV